MRLKQRAPLSVRVLLCLVLAVMLSPTSGCSTTQSIQPSADFPSDITALPSPNLTTIPELTPKPTPRPNHFSGWAPAPQGLAISADGKTAYVSFSLDDALLRVDLTTMTVTGSVDVSKAGNQLFSAATVLTSDGSKLYVANDGPGNVMVIDTKEMKLLTVLPIQPTSMRISKDGRSVYIPSYDGGLNVVNTADNSCKRIFIPGIVFGTICSSPQDPNVVYSAGIKITNGVSSPALFMFDLQNETVLQSFEIPQEYETDRCIQF